MKCSHLVHDKARVWAVVNAAMKLQVLLNGLAERSISFSRRSMLHAVSLTR